MRHVGPREGPAWDAPGLAGAQEPRREAEKVGRRAPSVFARLPVLKGAVGPSGSSVLPRVRVRGRFQPSFPMGMLRP